MAKHAPADVRRQQLMAACMEVCADKGYYGTRIDDVADRAGLSKGAVYHHFPGGKDELFLGLVESMLGEFTELINSAARDESMASATRRITESLVEMTEASPGLMRGLIEFYQLAVRKPEFRSRFIRYYEDLIGGLAALIRRGVAEGDFRADLDPDEIAHTYAVAGDGMMLLLIMLDQQDRLVSSLRSLNDLLFRALAPAKEAP